MRTLGEGGSGVVLEGLEHSTGARYAVKILREELGIDGERLKREFRTLSALSHPNVVRFFELFEEDNRLHLTMELVEGVNLLDYVRPGGGGAHPRSGSFTRTVDHAPPAPAAIDSAHGGVLDLDRLRASLASLVSGLVALHASGLVHRDIKPENVLVDANGRVVILDFGLAVAANATRAGELAGTRAYMAPEQWHGGASPASDFYSVGVILHQALTGVLPDGASTLAFPEETPLDLASLCADLLKPDPAARPSRDVLSLRLGFDASHALERTSHRARVERGARTFVGRARELALLADAFVCAREGTSTVVAIEGVSGVGKSALVSHFVSSIADASLVLEGRCYDRETVAFAGMDGVMNALGEQLRTKFADEVRRGVTAETLRRAGWLFPSLRAPHADAGRTLASALDPVARRQEGFAAVRDIFSCVRQTRPITLVLDDAHRMDAEAIALVRTLVEGAPLLVVLTQRPLDAPRAVAMRALASAAGRSVTVPLRPLEDAESRALASALLGQEADDASAAAIAAHAAGHPLFLFELASQPARGALEMDLESALRLRLRALDATSRRLLEHVALCSGPVSHAVVQRSARVTPAEYPWVLAQLRDENLVSFHTLAEATTVEPHHDRIAEIVAGAMSEPARVAAHMALAEALEAHASDAHAALAYHTLRGGDHTRAARYARIAASAAFTSLAFEQAARALELSLEAESDPEQRGEIEWQLGIALVNAGRGREAADAFMRSATHAPLEISLERRRRAGEQLLRSGHVEEGRVIITRVLEDLGEPVPGSRFALLGRLTWDVALLYARGLVLTPRATHTRTESVRLAATRTLAVTLSLMDMFTASAYQVRHLRLALESDDEEETIRSMVILASSLALVEGAPRRLSAHLLASANRLAGETHSPETAGFLALSEAISSLSAGDFVASERAAIRAESYFRDRCTGFAWELVTTRAFLLWAKCYQGKLAEVRAALPAILDQAHARGDRYAVATLELGPLHMAGLGADDPTHVRARCEAELPAWTAAKSDFQRFCGGFLLAQTDLYEGGAERAWTRLHAEWRTLDHAFMRGGQFFRTDSLALRARIAIARACVEPRNAGRWLARAESDLALLRRETLVFGRAMSAFVAAAIALRRGHANRALHELHMGREACDAHGMRMHAALARLASAGLVRDDAEATDAARELASLGVRNAARMLALWLPGMPMPELASGRRQRSERPT